MKNNLDFREILARLVQDTLWNGVRLELQKDIQDTDWQDFVKAIKNGEPDLYRKLKGAEKLASKYGSYFAMFEIYNNDIKINIAYPDIRNNMVRLSEGEGFNAVCVFEWYRVKNGVGLRTIESWTNQNVNRRVEQFGNGNKRIVNDSFEVSLPDYLKQHIKMGKEEHPYKVLPVYEFLNKYDINFDSNPSDLADWYPAKALFDWLNEFWFEYVKDEIHLDTTRIIGNIDYQSILHKDAPSKEQLANMLQNPNINFEDIDYWKEKANLYTPQEALMRKLIINSRGIDNKIDKMQSTFDANKHIEAFMKVLSNALEMCGYSWEKNGDAGNYENTASVMNVNKTVYQTTKMKKIQREDDWYQFLEKIATAYFIVVKNMEEEKAKQKAHEIKNNIKFEIISNMLNDYLKGDERTYKALEHQVISLRRALENLNPDMSKEDIDKELAELEQKQKEREQLLQDSSFGGELPQENDKNPPNFNDSNKNE